MIVEVIAVGTELLYGHTVNTNAAAIGSRLADAGLEHQLGQPHFQQPALDFLKSGNEFLVAAVQRQGDPLSWFMARLRV